jgi:probable HAF family extracellular repeat protein
MVGLGTLGGAVYASEAWGVSGDGNVVVGESRSSAMGGADEAFRWTEATGMVGLGDLAGGGNWTEARAVSRDGSVVVGSSGSSLGGEAFRWTEAGGMVGLGILSGNDYSTATAVNRDGSVVVGYNENGDLEVEEAFRWSAATGMLSLADWLARSGYTLTGWSDTLAYGVNDDGDIVVGVGTSANGREAFIARGESGLIGISSFTLSLQSVGNLVTQGLGTTQTILHGAHGHPGSNRALVGKRFMWVSGDLGQDDRHHSEDDFGLGELGVGYRYSDSLSISAALGRHWSDSSLLYDGSSDSDGTYLAVDADIRLSSGLPLYVTLTYLYGDSDLEIRRGYLNVGNLDASSGKTSQTFQALRTRLQWQSAWQYRQFVVHPYVEHNLVEVKSDAYTETGGGFPASYDASSETVHDMRLGADVNRQIGERTRFTGTLELVHRAESRGQGVSGQVVGLSAFELAGRDYKQDWLRATAGIERELSLGRISMTLNATNEGEDPKVWIGVNFSRPF